MVVSNLLGDNTTGIRSGGSNSTFADNLFTGSHSTRFASSGTGNNVVPYRGALSAPGQNYFYPPLVSDPHSGPIVNGRGRFDLTIGSNPLSAVQSQYNAARSAHPNDVIVLHLNGTFTGSGLTLFSNTAVLLNGTISSPSGKVIAATSQSNISISGGTIDGSNTTGRNAIHFSGCRMMQVDGMTLRNFGARLPRRGNYDIVRFAGGGTPYLFTRNRLNNGAARGVWSQLSGAKGIYTDNDIGNVNQDAIDLDSHTNAAVVKFNNLHDNIRSGVFVEEGARWNQAFGNLLPPHRHRPLPPRRGQRPLGLGQRQRADLAEHLLLQPQREQQAQPLRDVRADHHRQHQQQLPLQQRPAQRHERPDLPAQRDAELLLAEHRERERHELRQPGVGDVLQLTRRAVSVKGGDTRRGVGLSSIGIGAPGLARRPLPHHPACGSAPGGS